MDTAKLEFLRGALDVLILKALVWSPLHALHAQGGGEADPLRSSLMYLMSSTSFPFSP
jgi:hypothetical protein